VELEPTAAPPAIEYFTDVYLRGKPCPHCGYTRAPGELGRWHCPRCFNAYPEPEVPDDAKGRRLARTGFDPSTWVLVAANVLTIAAALWFDLRLGDVMLVYWCQSLMIGISFLIRMVIRLRIVGDPFFQDYVGKYFNAFFFFAHYGIFHLVYLFFLKPSTTPGLFSGFGLCVLLFALSHAHSLWYNIRRDRLASVDPQGLFWLPYARIVPMHITIIFGPRLVVGLDLVVFLGLKSLADVLMHVVEHRVLRRA
jgi:uncharacterized protein DUF6498